MTTRRTADRVVLAATLALLLVCLVKADDCAHVAVRFPHADPLWRRGELLGQAAAWAGAAAAWAAVAWRCVGPAPRAAALAAGLAYAVLIGARDSQVASAAGPLGEAGWVPAVLILAFARRRGEPGPVPHRRAADWGLSGVTLALLLACPAVAGYCVYEAVRAAPAVAPGSVATVRVMLVAAAVRWPGSGAAWAAVAWRCRGTAPRALALAAAAGYAAVGTLVVAPALGAAWAALPAKAVVTQAVSAFGEAGWVPAVPLLAFCRRWGNARVGIIATDPTDAEGE